MCPAPSIVRFCFENPWLNPLAFPFHLLYNKKNGIIIENNPSTMSREVEDEL